MPIDSSDQPANDQPTRRPPDVELAELDRKLAELIVDERWITAVSRGRSDPDDRAVIYARVYHQLSQRLREVRPALPGPDWCAFAKWSSKQVSAMYDLRTNGPFLKGVAKTLNLGKRPAKVFGAAFRTFVGRDEYFQNLQLANQIIFAEMALVHSRLIEAYEEHPDEEPDPERILDRLDETTDLMLEGFGVTRDDTRLTPADRDFLRRAVGFYHRAGDPGVDEAVRAQHLLAANVCLSAYEQKRADRLLAAAFAQPVRFAVIWLRDAVPGLVGRGLTEEQKTEIARRPAEEMPAVLQAFERSIVRFLTRYVLVINTPVGEVRLGRVISLPKSTASTVQRVAARALPTRVAPSPPVPELTDPDVLELVAMFDTAAQFTPRVASRLWTRYPERMRFIIAYFRVYSLVAEMLSDPYEAATWRITELPDNQSLVELIHRQLDVEMTTVDRREPLATRTGVSPPTIP
ncbi:MAG: hypothetical protein S0880_20605 [Actinomycetota bacterium]|nr:hypothetical protein [Actinomycetota bacterium]